MTQILSLPILAIALQTSSDGDALVDLGFAGKVRPGVAGAPIDLSDISFALAWRPVGPRRLGSWDVGDRVETLLPFPRDAPEDPVAFTATTDNGRLVNRATAGVLSLDVSAAELASLPLGHYAADLVASADGVQLVVGTASITHAAHGPCLVTAFTSTARNAVTAAAVGYVAGPPGLPGADAYQIAVADGFQGSREDWLASLAALGGGGVLTFAITGASSFAASHAFAHRPRVWLVDAAGEEVDTDTHHAPGQVTVIFPGPWTGTLYLG